MAKVKFIGDPRNPGESRPPLVIGDHVFETGKAVDVSNEALARKLSRNSHFEVTGLGREPQSTPAQSPTRADLDEALSQLPGDYTDPEFVVRGMRQHFGGLFTDADEARVRDVVKSAETAKPSDGMKVDELKAALDAKGIEYPAGALKADLQALYDESKA